MIETLTAKLLQIFQSMAWNDNTTPFTEVFDYKTEWSGSFPFLCFEYVWLESEILDTTNNYRDYIFNIWILQEITQVNGRRAASQALNKAMDHVINALDNNFTLDWLCEAGTLPVFGITEPMNIGNWSALVANLQIVCKTIYNINGFN